MTEIFQAALDLEPDRRAPYLEEACAGDESLRGEVEQMLEAHEGSGSFLNHPADVAGLTEPRTRELLIGKEISHYRIISSLGKGGMGEVYLAEDLQLGRKVALKLLPPEFTRDPHRLRRFEREAKSASALNHPNIITIYEIGEQDGVHFIATEFIEGRTLRHHLMGGKLQPAEAMQIAIQIGNALQAAHHAGIVHRDIKPENIMLRPDGFIKILDFGLVKLIEERNPSAEHRDSRSIPTSDTTPGTIMGTVYYLSPEQARGFSVDPRSDIWSLGVVIYEMLTGNLPFSGASQADILVSILSQKPKPLTKISPGVPYELERIVERAMAREVNDRYPTVEELCADLKGLQHRLMIETGSGQAAGSYETSLSAPVVTNQDLESATASLPPERARPAEPSQPAEPGVNSGMIVRVIVFIVLLTVGITGFVKFFKAKSETTVQTAPPDAQALPAESIAPASPSHNLTWWLEVQKMIGNKPDGRPYQSAGNNDFANGWGFRFNLVSPQSGYLYLINEGLDNSGEISYNLLFPTPQNNQSSAGIESNRTMQTGWYFFDRNPGTEKFWIVWSVRPVSMIEEAKRTADPQIKGVNTIHAVKDLLEQHEGNSVLKADEDKEISLISGTGDVLVSMVKLKHR